MGIGEAGGSRATAIVHVTPGLDGVSRAVNEAERGLLPAEATIVVRPAVRGRSRPCARRQVGSSGSSCRSCRGRPRGDALGEIDVGDGTWTEELREAYADRIVARLGEPDREPRARDARSASSLSPADLEALNCNLVGGDIYAGSCALDQNLLWRPSGAAAGPRDGRSTGLWQIGASHAPGPGPRRRARATSSRRS